MHTKLLVWGNNNQNLLSSASNQCLTRPQQIIINKSILKITATQKHITFITIQGQVYSYGSNIDGRLGVGAKDNFINHYQNPVKIQLPAKARDIKSGFSHVCVQLENNQIYSWGLGEYGSLGIGQFRSKNIPTKVLIPPRIKQISCGAMHTAFVDIDGNVYMCGSNEYGQLGVKNPDKIGTPILVSFPARVKQVTCGVFYTLLLTQKGDVYGMGNNKYAQLGVGHKINEFSPALIQDISNIVKIQAGYHSGALNSMCELFLWGSGSFGQLLRPRKFILNCPLTTLQIRGFFGIAMSQKQNKVFIWGNNTHGQLGNGGYISYKAPTEMKQLSLTKINKISCGVNFAIGILDDDNIKLKQQERSYSPINRFTARNEYQDKGYEGRSSLEGSPNRMKRYHDLQTSKRRLSQDITFPRQQHASHIRHQQQTSRSITSHKNYESLFLNLSKDYQILARRFRELQSQIQQREIKRSRDVQINQTESNLANQTLKEQVWILEKQLIVTKQELAIATERIVKVQTERMLLGREKQNLQIQFLQYRQKQREKQKQRQKQRQRQRSKQKQRQRQREKQKQRQKQRQNERQTERQKQRQRQITKPKSVYNSPTKSPTKSPINHIQNHIIDDLKKILQEKEQYIKDLQFERTKVNESLRQQKHYTIEIQTKYKAITINLQQIRVQNMDLKQLLIKSESRIMSYQDEIKRLTPMKQYEQKLTKQIIQYKSKCQQVEDRCVKYEIMLKNQKTTVSALQQERTNLYSMVDDLKNTQKQNKIIHSKQIQQEKDKVSKSQQRIKQLQTQINFEKDFVKKLQQKGVQMDRLRNQACKELQKVTDNYDKQKKKSKELQRQIQRFKTTQNQLKITRQQLEKQRTLNDQYKDKVTKQYKKKDQLIKQMQRQLQSKQVQYAETIQDKNSYIQTQKDQIKKGNQKVQKQKQQVKRLNKEVSLREENIQNLKEEILKLERKLKHTKQQMEKEVAEREEFAEQIGSLKRQQSKSQLEKEELQKKILELQKTVSDLQGSLRRQKVTVSQLENQIKDFERKVDSMKQQNNYMRSELQQANAAVEQSNRISEQLSNANKEFAQNQENLNKRIEQLQSKIYELQDQNRSYTPRYQAMIERNRQLDQRNKQLSQMVNKAIQIQAENYKTNILKQVQVSTNQIINDAEDQKRFKQRFNRKAPQPQYIEQSENQDNSFMRTPDVISRVKEEPYTKYMNQKIQTHRRRVSQSAQKLASILDLENGQGSAYTKRGSSITRRADDQHYQKINNHMESLKNQKQAFMEKINSFASKMKLL